MESARHLQKSWWVFLIRGIVAVLFGIIAIIAPHTTTAVLALSFGLFLLVSGVVSVIYGLTSIRKTNFWPVHLILGLVEAGFGVYLIQRPELTVALFIVFVALSLIFRGVIELAAAFEPGLSGGLRTLDIVAGALTILAGIVVWRYPVGGTLAFVWVLGLYALITGPVWIAFSLEARDGKLGAIKEA